MQLSIVTSLYRSADHLAEFHRRASAVARASAGDDYEIILVNDGSPDASLDIATGLADRDPHVVVIDLSRNFGQHKALMTGLAQSRGARVLILDGDLEEEPEWLAPFDALMTKRGCDVVYGVQRERRGDAFDRFAGGAFYVVFRLLTGLKIPENATTARLMTRRYVDALLQHEEREAFMAGLWLLTGFEQAAHPVDKHSFSPTTYNLSRKLSMLVTSVTSFSSAPLVGIFYVGLAISFAATLFAAYLLLNWLIGERPPAGWTSVMASVWLLGGMIIAFLGVIGVYLHKVFSETKRRPYTIVREVYTGQTEPGNME